MNPPTGPMRHIQSRGTVPQSRSEPEEAACRGAHDLDAALLDQMQSHADPQLPSPRPLTRPVAIQLDESMLGRMRAPAKRRQEGHQTLLRGFVVERLCEEEKREGLIG